MTINCLKGLLPLLQLWHVYHICLSLLTDISENKVSLPFRADQYLGSYFSFIFAWYLILVFLKRDIGKFLCFVCKILFSGILFTCHYFSKFRIFLKLLFVMLSNINLSYLMDQDGYLSNFCEDCLTKFLTICY